MKAEPPAASARRDPARVLLTRPEAANDALQAALHARGIAVRTMPLTAIEALPEASETPEPIAELDRYAAVIVTSKPAARLFVERVEDRWPQWPLGIKWWALGRGTAQILEAAGLTVGLPESGHRSEDLLKLPCWVEEQPRTLLVKGCGGRNLIASTLEDAGCKLDTLELYQRRLLQPEPGALQQVLTDWQPDAIVLLSAESLRHFLHLSQNVGYALHQTRFIVPSQRVAAELPSAAGVASILENMSLEGQLNTICCALKDRNPDKNR